MGVRVVIYGTRTHGDLFDFEVGGHDGAYKGRVHVIVPFIGRKNGILTANIVIMMYMGGTAHALSNSLLACGIGAWLGTFGVAAPMSCTGSSVYYCIFLNFVFGGRSATLFTDHTTMFRLMFGRTRATWPPRRMRERMR